MHRLVVNGRLTIHWPAGPRPLSCAHPPLTLPPQQFASHSRGHPVPYGYAPAIYHHSPYMYSLPQVTFVKLAAAPVSRLVLTPSLPQPHQSPYTPRPLPSVTPPVASSTITPRILTADEVAENNARREKAMEDLRVKEQETREKLLALQKVLTWRLQC